MTERQKYDSSVKELVLSIERLQDLQDRFEGQQSLMAEQELERGSLMVQNARLNNHNLQLVE